MQLNILTDTKTHLTPDDISDPSVRKALSAPSFRVFNAICEEWALSITERCVLLGELPESTYYKYKKGSVGTFNYDLLERISLVLGIYKALKLIFVHSDRRKRWLKAKNSEDVFGGNAPIELMLQGSIRNLYATRCYLDAWRGVK